MHFDQTKFGKPQPVVLPSERLPGHLVAGIKIVGIEVIQAVQHFSLTEPGGSGGTAVVVIGSGGPEVVVIGSPFANNSVPLVAGKRTMVRVYVASTIRDGVPVRGNLRVFALNGTPPLSLDAGYPINLDRAFVARPVDLIDRNTLDHTLNFVLPVLLLRGSVRLEVDVYVNDPYFSPESDFSTLTVEFHERRLPKKLVHMLIHNIAAPAPETISDYLRDLDQVIACYPAADDSFFPLYYLPGYEAIESASDLTQTGLQPLFSQIEQIMANFNMNGYVLTGLLARPPHGGIVGQEGVPIVFEDSAGFAHELGHKFGLHHAGEDPRIPSNTDELGLDMSSLTLIRAGASELMNPMASTPWWVSTATWQILFDAFN